MAETHKLSEPFKVGSKTLTELKVQPEGGVVTTGLMLQLLSDFQAHFPGIYADSKIKLTAEPFLILALASYNGLTLEEVQELPFHETFAAMAGVVSFLLKKSG
jgi:hypothetical protein